MAGGTWLTSRSSQCRAQAGCHRQEVDPTQPGGEGPCKPGTPTRASTGTRGPRPPRGRRSGLQEGATARAKGSGGRRRWNSAESAPRPLGGTCGNPAAASPAGRASAPVGPSAGSGVGDGRAGAGRSPASQVNSGRRLPLLTSLHPGGVRSSLASPHGNSRSSSGNCPGRRQRRQLLLQSCPGRRLYSASLASPRPGCSRRTRRHLGRATSASPRDVRSHWLARRARASCDCLHGAGARRVGGGGWAARDPGPPLRAGSRATVVAGLRAGGAAEAGCRRRNWHLASPRPCGARRVLGTLGCGPLRSAVT